jgi:hypothetical protein
MSLADVFSPNAWANEADKYYDIVMEEDPLENGVIDGKADAFRHAFGSAVFAFYCSAFLSNATFNGHEWLSSNSPLAHRMDLFNNEIGRRIGLEFAKEYAEKFYDVLQILKEGGTIPDRDEFLDNLKLNIANDIALKMASGDLALNLEDPRLKEFYPDDPKLESGEEGVNPYDIWQINKDILDFLKGGGNEEGSDPNDYGDYADNWQRAYEQARQQALVHIDPLVIDLNRDGKVDLVNNRYFDIDVDGFAQQTRWIDGADGLLALDRNGDGVINDGSELFGDRTAKSDGTLATSGFDALRELDSNGDGVIDGNDETFADLKVWTDVNGDGVFDSDELLTLEEAGIDSIDATNLTKGGNIEGGAAGQKSTITWDDGSTSVIQELFPTTNQLLTEETTLVDVPRDIAVLPDLHSAGFMHSLHQAMALDETGQLRDAVEAYLRSDIAGQDAAINNLLFAWAEVEHIAPASRGGSIDARKLTFIEKFMGSNFVGVNGANPNANAAPILNGLYESIKNTLEANIIMQTSLEWFFNSADDSIDPETGHTIVNYEASFRTLNFLYDVLPDYAIKDIYALKKVLRAENILGSAEDNSAFTEALSTYPLFVKALDPNMNLVIGTGDGSTITGSNGNDVILGGRSL